MKKFMYLHIGFEKPTEEVMEAWNAWFKSIADRQVDQGGFNSGIEISRNGVKELPWDADRITGYNIIEAEDMNEAEKLAGDNPFVTSIQIYELR